MIIEALFFVALIPDERTCDQVNQFKQYAAQHFNSSRALRSPPHITLFPPFRWPANQQFQLVEQLQMVGQNQAPFQVQLEGFDCFAPRVIFVDVHPNPAMNQLQAAIQSRLLQELQLQADRPLGRFHPHMTVAFRDLKKAIFPQAWAHFSQLNYQQHFEAKSFYLLRHQHKRWNIDHRFELNGN